MKSYLSIILYGSRIKLTKAHKPVFSKSKPPTGDKQPEYFVRMKVCHCDMDDALERARPQIGETVLNTIQID